MIRTPAQHNTTHPAGCVTYPQPLQKEIDHWKSDEHSERVLEVGRKRGYAQGWKDGYEAAMVGIFNNPPDADNSESSR